MKTFLRLTAMLGLATLMIPFGVNAQGQGQGQGHEHGQEQGKGAPAGQPAPAAHAAPPQNQAAPPQRQEAPQSQAQPQHQAGATRGRTRCPLLIAHQAQDRPVRSDLTGADRRSRGRSGVPGFRAFRKRRANPEGSALVSMAFAAQ